MSLTCFSLVLYFYTPRKHKTFRVLDVFRVVILWWSIDCDRPNWLYGDPTIEHENVKARVFFIFLILLIVKLVTHGYLFSELFFPIHTKM